MANLIDEAKQYVSPKAKNISEAGIFDGIELVPVMENRVDENGKPFVVRIVTIRGEKYRVPDTVLEGIKNTIIARPSVTKFSVTKTGSTKNDTKYQVIAQN
jgi:hypothetical protein